MSDTPRTDIMVTGNSDPTVDEYEDLAGWARTLERECTIAKDLISKIADDCNAWSNTYHGLKKQHDTIQVKMECVQGKVRDALLKHMPHDTIGRQEFYNYVFA